MGKKVGKAIGSVIDGVQQTIKGVGQTFVGIITLDIDLIGEGIGNYFGGVFNTATLGGWDALGQWVKDELTPETPEATYSSRKVMARNADTPRAITYGRNRIGGQLVLFESTGADSQELHMIIVMAPHQVHAIGEIYFNDDLAFDASGTPAPAFSGKAELIKVLGDQTTANATIVSRLADWTNDHKLLGCAYVYVRLFYDKELYSRSAPNVSAVIDGKLIYDPRTDTTGYSTNHALVCLDYLQSELGFRVEDDEVDTASFIAGANISDQLVASGPGTTEPRYTVNGTVSLASSPIDNLNSLLRGGAAHINYEQGEFSYIPGAYIAPPVENSFNEDDLVGGIQIVSGQGKAELTNTAKGTYIDARQDYEPVSFPAISPSDYVTRDGEELVSELPMPFANTPTLARRLAKIAIEQSRFGLRVQLSLKWGAMRLLPGERIKLSIARFGWVDKVFRIQPGGMSVSMSGAVSLSLVEDAPSVWGWTEGEAIDVTPPPALNLPTTTPIPAPTGLTIVERINTPNTSAANRVTLFLSVTPPADARYATSEFSYRLAGTDDVWSVIGYERLGASKVLPASGDKYEFRARPVSTVGRIWDTEVVDTYTVFDVMTEGAKDALELRLPDIYGLRILNTVPGTLNEFKSGNAEFSWQPQSSTIWTELSDDRIGVDAGQLDPFFDDYRLRFYSNGVLRFEDYARQPRYTLSLEDNRRYNIGRAFRCEVTARGANGQVGRAESIDVVNPASGIVTGITSEQVEDGVFLTYTPPNDIDFVGVKIRGKLYTGSSITIDPLTARSETITITSVDQFGDGDSTTIVLTNPAPAAPSGIQTAVGIGSFTVRFVPDSTDFDFVGTKFEWRPVGGSYSAPVVLAGNEATQNGLGQDTEYEIRLTSVDKLGDGGSTTVIVTTASLDASEVGGLGAWATQNVVSTEFVSDFMASGSIVSALLAANAVIEEKIANGAIVSDKLAAQAVTNAKLALLAVQAGNLADGAVETGKLADLAVEAAKLAESAVTATKIANLAVGTAAIAEAAITEAKIANLAVGTAAIQDLAVTDAKVGTVSAGKLIAGAIAVQVDVGEDSNRVLLDGETGVVQTVNSGFTVTMGAHVVDGITYVLSGNDGLVPTFGFLPNGGVDIGFGGLVYDPSTDTTTFSGALSAATGTFAGELSAASGTFSGTLVAVDGEFTGTLTGVDGTFSGELSAATGNIQDVNAVNLSVTGESIFGDAPSGQFIEFSGGVLKFGPNATIGSNENRTVTVGSGGDFATLNAALEALSRVVPAYKNGGFTATIEILDGTTLTERINISGVDLSFIRLSLEIPDTEPAIILSGNEPFLTVTNGGVSPVIAFNMRQQSSYDYSLIYCDNDGLVLLGESDTDRIVIARPGDETTTYPLIDIGFQGRLQIIEKNTEILVEGGGVRFEGADIRMHDLTITSGGRSDSLPYRQTSSEVIMSGNISIQSNFTTASFYAMLVTGRSVLRCAEIYNNQSTLPPSRGVRINGSFLYCSRLESRYCTADPVEIAAVSNANIEVLSTGILGGGGTSQAQFSGRSFGQISSQVSGSYNDLDSTCFILGP